MTPQTSPQSRACVLPGCGRRYNPEFRETATPPRYCSVECWRVADIVAAAALARRKETSRDV